MHFDIFFLIAIHQHISVTLTTIIRVCQRILIKHKLLICIGETTGGNG